MHWLLEMKSSYTDICLSDLDYSNALYTELPLRSVWKLQLFQIPEVGLLTVVAYK